jgi:hypothetical protein
MKWLVSVRFVHGQQEERAALPPPNRLMSESWWRKG